MKLEDWRKAKGLTLAQVAHKVGASHATVVRRWCAGEVIPAPEFQMAIQEATGGAVCPSDWVAGGMVAKKRKGR